MQKLIFILMIFVSISAYSQKLEVFVPCNQEVEFSSQVKIYHVGCEKKLNKELSQAVSQDLSNREQIAKEFVQKHKKQYKKDFEDSSKMSVYGLKSLPAIVIDSKYVVYGTTNINTAINKYRQGHYQ
ncbi:DUF1525 domain-containing protein [Francisella sp. SYW-9]|uniref:DUF1525 domain-containing protein n=1 Tax=Francisella sp. SYW-9 TaxID=2610888 RepID=UPI00123D2265|nr:DUF1525 domain-containing protein [Francisella sp. SYW-9]